MRLTSNHLAILQSIKGAPFGASYSTAIARDTGQTQQAVYNRLNKLALDGLVERAAVPPDWAEENARQKGITQFWRLTATGKEILENEN